jgi:hypothetical protein
LRDTVDAGLISTSFIPTNDMIADILTKPLHRSLVFSFRQMMGIYVMGEL